MKAYGLLLLAAILCALFSDQIDKMFAMDNQLKKVLFFFGWSFSGLHDWSSGIHFFNH